MNSVLGIDIGTSGVKTSLFSCTGDHIASEEESYKTTYKQDGLIEQNPEDWWLCTVKTVRSLMKRNQNYQVVALSLSTQGGTLVPVDVSNIPTHPAIVWSDQRCSEARAQLLTRFSEKEIYNSCGWPVSNGLNLLQILQLKIDQPKIFEKTDYFLSVPDYFALRMTGKRAIDYSNAGINQLCDVLNKKWNNKILNFIGITEKNLSPLMDSGSTLGNLLPEIVTKLGLRGEVKFVIGGHDQYCAAFGVGLIDPGDVVIGTGTAWAVNVITEEPIIAFELGSTFSRHVVQDNWGSLISLSFGGQSLEWLRILMQKENKNNLAFSYKTIDSKIAERNVQDDIFFIPFFNGIFDELKSPDLTAGFLGLKTNHDSYDMFRAIMESVAFYASYLVKLLSKDKKPEYITLTGGAGNSDVWVQYVADILGLPVHIPENKNASCRGAAMLAFSAYNKTKTPEEIVDIFSCYKGKKIVPGENTIFMQRKQEKFIRLLTYLSEFYNAESLIKD